MSHKRENCWEYLKCGREPGGKNEKEFGLCPAATDTSFDGINSGKNAGRICWAVAGTCREGEVYGTYAQKRPSCVGCEFYRLVQEEERTSKENNNVLGLFSYNENSPLLKELTIKVVKAGKRFINQGEVRDQAYIIQSGSCLVIVEKDGQLYPADHRGRGDILGISSLLTGEPQRAHVEAETDMELWVMSRALFEDISRETPELLDFLTELVASRFDSRRPSADRDIGKYTAGDIIGRGSHSIVYRGLNRSLDMPVAIKMLRHDRAVIPEFSERFRDEGKTIARLNHENIVKVYDVEEIYKTIFIIMEYLEGMTLDRVLEKTPRVPFAQILDILLQVCSGLAYAHEHGILHQDIRPGNIFVQLDGKIKIVDFGLACRPGDVEDLYWPGAIFYSSPEYIEGNPVDGRSDIYSLGITTFEMIAGKKLFSEDDPAKAVQLHLKGEFPDLRDFVPDVPEEIRKFVFMACRRDPAERYQNLYQAVEDLRPLADVLELKSRVGLYGKRKMGAVFLAEGDYNSPDAVGLKLSKGLVTQGGQVRATILFTDIVGSTEKAFELGDSLWGNLVEHHHTLVRREIAKFQGNEVETTGDGFVAIFDNAADAIQCACAISHRVQSLGIKIRAGLHFGECEVVDGVLHGITVHIGFRVAAKAEPNEVLVSSAVKNAVSGTEIGFVDRGSHVLKGIPGEWHLYAVE
jgi:class 3 adenylate cyclase/CRP-like cAMP-binding protein